MEKIEADSPATLVQRLRSALCVTQKELADKASVDRALIARLELGREPRWPTLRRLMAALGGRLELAARFERPLEALAEDFLPARHKEFLERSARRQRRRFGLL